PGRNRARSLSCAVCLAIEEEQAKLICERQGADLLRSQREEEIKARIPRLRRNVSSSRSSLSLMTNGRRCYDAGSFIAGSVPSGPGTRRRPNVGPRTDGSWAVKS